MCFEGTKDLRGCQLFWPLCFILYVHSLNHWNKNGENCIKFGSIECKNEEFKVKQRKKCRYIHIILKHSIDHKWNVERLWFNDITKLNVVVSCNVKTTQYASRYYFYYCIIFSTFTHKIKICSGTCCKFL